MDDIVKEEKYSDFGAGFAYCLGLFLAHAERPTVLSDHSLWFNAAGDHVFDLCIDPAILGDEIAEKATKFRSFVLTRRFSFNTEATLEDKEYAIQEAKDLLFVWDQKSGVSCVRGKYE